MVRCLSLFAVLQPATAAWVVLPSANLDVHGECGCSSGGCKDVPGKYHFAGTLANDTACASTCQAAVGNCTMWFRSSHSNHCWWKLGDEWNPKKYDGITSGCASDSVSGCGTFPAPTPPPAPTPLPTIISGQGHFRYQYDATKFQLPASVQLLHGHGVARDAAGNIYFTYVDAAPKRPEARALVRFAPDGTGGTLLGNATLAEGVPHGIKVQLEADGEYLYHANNAATVTKTTLEGEIVWRTDMTSVWSGNKTHWPFKPTDLLIPPGQPNTVLVADGYGKSKLHAFDTQTGQWTGAVFGGKGKSSIPGEAATFNCDHGLSIDDRVGKIVVSDRSNHRLVWIENDGTLIKTLNVTGSEPLPCNAQTSSGTSLGGDYLLVPGLGIDYADPGPWLNGSVSIYDADNALVSTIESARYLGTGVLGHNNPHDAIFLQNGDIALAVWKGHEKGSLGGLEYWTLLPEEDPVAYV